MVLTPQTIEALVAALHRKDLEATMFAIESSVPWTGCREIMVEGRRMQVRDARCALRVREVMQEPRSNDGLVILTDLDERAFGRENLSRMALRRIESVQPWPAVRLIFGVASVDPRLVRHGWMAERLLQAPPDGRAIAGGTLEFETAWGILLAGFGLSSTRPSEDEFLAAASRPAFAQAFNALPPEGKQEFRSIVQGSLDRFGMTVLAVVEKGYGDHVLAAGIVAQCIFEVHDPHALQVRGAFAERFGVKGLEGSVASRWGAVTRKLLGRPDSAALASRVRSQADGILTNDLDGAVLAHASDDLPSGLTQRVRGLTTLVEKALVGAISDVLLDELRDAVRRVEQHTLAVGHGDSERTAMAARLVRWLTVERASAPSLEAALRSYADDGCWVDRARIAVRDGESAPEARRIYQALAERVATERAKLNADVAPAAISASLPSGELLGVEHVLEQVVVPLAAERPVALIVMDGMSHAVALDLIRALEEIAWIRYKPRGQSAARLVVSAIPSVTQFSRTSLLCGALRDGGQPDEIAGFASFLQSRGLGTSRSPKVFHKSALDAVSSDVETAIESDAKVVACVVNAIDAQLSGSDQLRMLWTLRAIPVFARLVRACERAGRAIVLVSDHGHLVEESTTQLAANGSGVLNPGARWRGVDGDVRPGELVARGPRVLAPGGECVVAADERVRYVGRHAGYHGGVTVQEIACPLHVFVHSSSDAGLANWIPIESTPPTWWSSEVTAAVIRRPVQPIVSGGSRSPRAKPATGADEPGLFLGAGTTWISALLASATYEQQRKNVGRAPLADDVARRMLDVFVAQGADGSMSIKITEQALAARIELSVGDTRKRVTLLRNLLNVDGYEVLAQPDRESYVLDIAMLKAQFELEGNAA